MTTSKKVQFTLALCFGLLAKNAEAQQTLNIAGNSVKINGQSFEYSIGEMTLISTERASNFIITQGLLQPANTGTTLDNSNTSTSNDDLLNNVKVYPNPTENFIYVETIATTESEINYTLIDAQGKLILSESQSQKIGTNRFSVDMKALAAGSYFLLVNPNNTKSTQDKISFKIQKIN